MIKLSTAGMFLVLCASAATGVVLAQDALGTTAPVDAAPAPAPAAASAPVQTPVPAAVAPAAPAPASPAPANQPAASPGSAAAVPPAKTGAAPAPAGVAANPAAAAAPAPAGANASPANAAAVPAAPAASPKKIEFGREPTVGVRASGMDSPEGMPRGVHIQSEKLSPLFLKKSDEAMVKTVDRGRELYYDDVTISSNGLYCAVCHPHASVTHPETYPKYKQQFDRVVTMQEFINWCIVVPQQGKSQPLGGEVLTAIEAYQAAQNKGMSLEPGFPGP